jgi:hypothetical protein
VSVQPKDISPSTGSVGIAVSNIVSENLPVLSETNAATSILRKIHSAGCIIIMKTIAGSTLRPWFSVVGTKNEF